MDIEITNYLNIVIEGIKGIALYIMPIAAFIVSLIALKRSNDTMKVQVQLSEVEEKLKEYELALKKHELAKIQAEENEEKKANIEARVIQISRGSYKLKVWNSGNATAYNVVVSVPEECGVMIIKNKMPFEYLEPGKSFEERVMLYGRFSAKFNITSTWKDEEENQCKNVQLESI